MEAEEAFNENKVAILPVGTIHGHGPTPISVDSSSVERISEKVAEKTNTLTLPLLAYGENEKQKYYPGSITISQNTLENVYIDIFRSIRRNGIRKIVVINGHGGNRVALEAAARSVRDTGVLVAVLDWWSIGKQREKDLWVEGDHSYMCELAVALAIDGKKIADFRNKNKGYKGEWGKQYTTKKIFGENIIPLGFNTFKFEGADIMIPIQAWDIDEEGPPYTGEEKIEELYQRGQEILKRVIDYIASFIKEFEKIEIDDALKSTDDF
jgi:creatinine amidohydrolase/Fe(II)-dependent formamide hydrolase-like protein